MSKLGRRKLQYQGFHEAICFIFDGRNITGKHTNLKNHNIIMETILYVQTGRRKLQYQGFHKSFFFIFDRRNITGKHKRTQI